MGGWRNPRDMELSPARHDHHEALAAGRFGETCAVARKHGAMPDPDVFAKRFIASGGCACSGAHHVAECPDAKRLVA